MGDFHQSGVITTLHNLGSRPVEALEAELVEFAKTRPMALILPCLYSELEGPAMDNIVAELAKVPYLSQIVIGLDRADESQYKKALEFFKALPQDHVVLWNDGPRLKALDSELSKLGLEPKQMGKGRNVWYCMGYLLSQGKAEAIALHDCDIVTYSRDMLAKLIYPVANPAFNYEFCKGYYARVANGTINGRVCRLLVTPLLRALKKIIGAHDYLEYMDSYRYPLAGEFSMRADVLQGIRIPSDWGLEIGVLSETYRNYSNNHLCQVDIADIYDHKHQDVSYDDETGGLSRMSIDISKAIFRKLATTGVVLSLETFRTLKATYYRLALDMVDSYHSDAMINGLNLDIHNEEKAVELFAENIMKAGHHFLENPQETPFIPSWTRVKSALPELGNNFIAAVEQDLKQYD
ncbi:MAG: glycosyl transferase [Gammaproteobacteria bacterium]|jgi:glucosyl-3-phosphoglycerate synthase|nr:glycosyl transferase [Gammaproteobacteria bacterium]